MYTYKEIVYVVNEATRQEITSYAKEFDLDRVPITAEMRRAHDVAEARIKSDPSCRKSHTVIVVDVSGSMKKTDIWGARDRLKSVWISIALDFVAHRIEACEACPLDVVSIITLEEEPKTVAREWPCDYILYNLIANIHNRSTILPRGHGPFIPALRVAERMLTARPHQACALSLCLFTDGSPSDFIQGNNTKDFYNEMIIYRIQSLAEKYGSKMSFTFIAIGDQQDFNLLERMVAKAKDYRSKAALVTPSSTLSGMGMAMSSAASSVTESQIELRDAITLTQRKDRSVLRESSAQSAIKLTKVNNQDFEMIPMRRVRRTVYKEWIENKQRKSAFSSMKPQHPHAAFVAICNRTFGEGGERYAFRFYEVGANGETIVGKPLVAKESRFVLQSEEGNSSSKARDHFVKEFCKGQQLALRLAEEFNNKLKNIKRVHPSTPSIKVLDCSVYEIQGTDGKTKSVLVEERLDESAWHKWNSNNGYVEGMSRVPDNTPAQLSDAMMKLKRLDLITEEDEEEEDEDEEDDYDIDDDYSCDFGLSEYKKNEYKRPIVFTPSEVAQAFSHFTHWASGGKRLVCDLQGVHDKQNNKIILSDPVIHYHNDFQEGHQSQPRYGNTNRGRKGMAMFFNTHVCNQLCNLTTRGYRNDHVESPPILRQNQAVNRNAQRHSTHEYAVSAFY
jgi:Alpha-kinase family